MIHSCAAILALAAALVQAPATSDSRPAATDELTIEQGKIRGVVVGRRRDVHAYKGIPYAEPPVGELRWKAPLPPRKWEGVRDCSNFGPACPQKYSRFMSAVPLAAINAFSEDCLTLNVYRPAKTSSEKLPVMVWIHGGAYTEGSASQGIYDGAALARKGVVLVSINYRLGPFGFCAHPALSAESEQNVSGNYGLLDQIESLRWVKRNIAAFGGDPERVTIFGESAGGGSVFCLLVCPQAKGLFHRAIAQSSPEMTLPYLKRDSLGRVSAEQQGKILIAQCGGSEGAGAAAMRSIPAEKLVKVFPTLEVMNREPTLDAVRLPIGPIVDGHIIPEDPNNALAAGRGHRVPFIAGNTRDEAGVFLMFVRIPTDEDRYQSLVVQEFGAAAERILFAYPPAAEAKAIRSTVVHLLTDLVYGVQARSSVMQSSAAGQRAYRYVFSRASRMILTATAGAHHGYDVPYVFDVDNRLLNWDAWDRRLAEMTGQYWVNFAANGDPNGPGLPTWPAYSADSEPSLELGDKIVVLEKYRKKQLDVMDQFLRERNKSDSPGSSKK